MPHHTPDGALLQWGLSSCQYSSSCSYPVGPQGYCPQQQPPNMMELYLSILKVHTTQE